MFYNQPAEPGAQRVEGVLTVRFAEVDPQIEKTVLLASLDSVASSDFGRLTGGLGVEFSRDGQPFAAFSPAGLSQDSDLALVEVYRRSGEWKLRSVVQGWTEGLAGAASEYGTDVSSDDAVPPPVPTSQAHPNGPQPSGEG